MIPAEIKDLNSSLILVFQLTLKKLFLITHYIKFKHIGTDLAHIVLSHARLKVIVIVIQDDKFHSENISVNYNR